MVFLKLPSSSVPGSGPVRCPAVVKRLDYEVELAVVMGADGAIAGYAVADDVSARDLQKREPRWVRAKGFDTSCPWGPWITTADEVADPENLRIASQVNGETRQDSTTADLVFGPRALVDFIAETCTLAPGDLILTGTPQGVGQAMDPPRFLQPGDVVRCEIEGLGAIEHPIEMRLRGRRPRGRGRRSCSSTASPTRAPSGADQVGPLAEAGFRVIVPDLRGFGASERPEGVEPTAPPRWSAT